MHGGGVFGEIALLVILAAGMGFLGLLMRQPLVVAFIAAGILAGPGALGLVSSPEFVATLAQVSIAVLLFLVGLKLDLGLVRSLGKVAVATGLGQVGFTAVFGFVICLGLGIDPVTSAYIAVALTFSSTIIIVKLLTDKQEIASLHGRIALGFLIVQDLFVVFVMIALSAFGLGAGNGGGLADVLRLALGGVALVGGTLAFIRWVADPLLRAMARSPELLVIFAVGWAGGLAALSDMIGFGKEIGGLLAGVSLASTEFRDSVGSRLASLRDFLLLFFFINLGAGLDLSSVGAQVWPAVVLSVFVLVGNPLIVLAILGAMGYRRRTGFLAGLTVAQISEFSLIFMAMGMALGHVDDAAMGLVTLVGLVTIALSVYMITWSHRLFAQFEPWLGWAERHDPFREVAEEGRESAASHDVILFGLGRYGSRIGSGLAARGLRVLGVDFDPDALAAWRAAGRDGAFGDATDPEFLAHLPMADARAVVSAVPRDGGPLTEANPQVALVQGLRAVGFGGVIALSADGARQAEGLHAAGADLVLTPFSDAADHAVERLAAAVTEAAARRA
ncbi:MAG TPA: cation:proton antiporter [Paracoccaceae bacterium]|nr:cation:proton antiporter [Paracoccaceae bacterium]